MKVLIACGGSGGHLFPGISVASKLKYRDVSTEIFFICTQRTQDIHILSGYNYTFKAIPIEGLKCYPNLGLNFCRSLVKLLWSIIQCLVIIRKERPDVVVGFGGYLSVPVIIVSSMLKIPTLIHEQNIIPSLSNCLLARFADCIALTFKKTATFFRNKSKLVITGNPLRGELLKNIDRKTCLNSFGFDEKRFTILVMGGSQGSHKINQIFTEMLAYKIDGSQRENFQIIHITGYADYEFVHSQYQKLSVLYRCFSFLKKINYAYLAADLVIARAGAGTISEISYFHRPAILIPHPEEKVHQRENALVLSDKDAAVVIFDRDLSPDRLKSELLNLVNNQRRRILMSERIGEFACAQAADNLAEVILNIKECRR